MCIDKSNKPSPGIKQKNYDGKADWTMKGLRG